MINPAATILTKNCFSTPFKVIWVKNKKKNETIGAGARVDRYVYFNW